MKPSLCSYIIEKVIKLEERVIMIYKVFYQENAKEVPIREKTKSFYIEANSEREVRLQLKGRNINIEFIQPVEDEYLAYEQQSEDFKVLEI